MQKSDQVALLRTFLRQVGSGGTVGLSVPGLQLFPLLQPLCSYPVNFLAAPRRGVPCSLIPPTGLFPLLVLYQEGTLLLQCCVSGSCSATGLSSNATFLRGLL